MTLPQMLAAHARRYGHSKVALREKEFGIWQEVSWADYAAHVRAVTLGLELLGLRREETLAIISGNRPAWLYTECNVTPTKLQALERYITARTQVYRIQSIGYFERSGPVARIEAVIDTNQGKPRILYYRDLSELGRAIDPRNN